MSRRYYPAIVDRAKKSYGVSFPDLPGCVGAGKSVKDAIADAERALSFHIRSMVEDNDPIPEPSDPARIKGEPDIEEVVRVLIPVDVPRKTVRINVSLDEKLLGDIDRAANENGYTRSGFLAAAARKLIDA
jgi:predicted RNase H-like HicB family nuclease